MLPDMGDQSWAHAEGRIWMSRILVVHGCACIPLMCTCHEATWGQARATMTDDQRREDAREYVRQLRAFYIHASVFAGSMVVIFAVNVAVNVAAGIANEWWAWWSVWVLLGWGLGLTIHGLVVRMSRPGGIMGPAWEEEQVDKILSSENIQPPR